MNKRLLLSLFGMMFCAMMMAITAPQKGKYYRIVNLNPEKSTSVEGESEPYAISENKTTHGLTTVAQDNDTKTRYAQIWYCVTATSSSAKFYNAQTHRYIGTASKSTQVYTTETSTNHTLSNKSTYYLIDSDDAMLHSDGSNVVVGWNDSGDVSNHWDFEEATVDSTVMLAVYNAYVKEAAEKSALEKIAAKASTYDPIIRGYFNDYGCTDMKAEYSAMSDADFKAKMTSDGISESEVQTMVLGIKNKWSTECDATQSAKFRVQEYTCYPRADKAKAYTKATQISDMNNITGIWTNSIQLLYIFVDSDIPSNATLTITQTSGDQGRAWYNQGTALHKGLNIVYCGTDMANNWIMYTVPFSTTKPIAEYPKIKIHIEGGYVIGYMNTLDADGNILAEDVCNANWKTQLQYANKVLKANGVTDLASDRIDYAVKGQRGLMFFPVECYNRIWATTPYNAYYKTNYNIYKSMRFFDNVLKWEWGTMGITKRIVDGEGAPSKSRENMEGGYDIQPTYINNLACGMMIWEGGKNPYSSDGYTSMPGVGAVESSYNAERADFDVWCVGHESGHNNQGTINLPSSMESSNNLFSNICQYQNGYRLSRGMTFMENMDYIPTNTQFAQRSISMTLRMYFNLYLYYHRAKYNTKFYPTLHKLLRDDPMYFGGDGWWEGVGDGNGGANMGKSSNSWLKFYEKACDAAQEDLTEYFRMWGFFIPSKDAQYAVYNSNNKKWYVYCGDYSSYYIENSQDSINAAIKRVKAKKYPENRQICFVEDRLVPQKRFDAWDTTGTSWKVTSDGGDASSESTLKSWYGDLGYIGYYENGSMKIATADDYTYNATGTSIKMTAKTADAGVGIIVYNEAGDTILWMSNRLSFTIPASVAARKFIIKIINADGTEVLAKNAIDSDDPAVLKTALQASIDASETYTKLRDTTNKKVGFYTKEATDKLVELVAEGNSAISSKTESQYKPLAIAINSEIINVANNGEKVQRISNGIYSLRNYEFASKSGEASYLYTGTSASSSLNTTTCRWAFIPVSSESNKVYLQNYSTKKYISHVGDNGAFAVAAASQADALQFDIQEYGNGAFCFAFTTSEGKTKYINETPSWNGIISWDWASGSAWYITEVTTVTEFTAADLQDLVDESAALRDSVCTIAETVTPYALTADDGASELTGGVVWSNHPSSLSSYPIANLVDGNTATKFQSDETSTTEEYHNIQVDLGSATANKSKFLRAVFYRGTKTTNKWRPTAMTVYNSSSTGETKTWTKIKDVDLGSSSESTFDLVVTTARRFWRFDVTATADNTSASAYPYFRLNDMTLSNVEQVVTMKEPYTAVATSYVTTCVTKEEAVKSALAGDASILNYQTAAVDLKKAISSLRSQIAPYRPTGIEGINAADQEATGTDNMFDLSGRRINNAQHGVYIINGKKVVR